MADQNKNIHKAFLCVTALGAAALLAPLARDMHQAHAQQQADYKLALACKSKMAKNEACPANENSALERARALERKNAHLWVFKRGTI